MTRTFPGFVLAGLCAAIAFAWLTSEGARLAGVDAAEPGEVRTVDLGGLLMPPPQSRTDAGGDVKEPDPNEPVLPATAPPSTEPEAPLLAPVAEGPVSPVVLDDEPAEALGAAPSLDGPPEPARATVRDPMTVERRSALLHRILALYGDLRPREGRQ